MHSTLEQRTPKNQSNKLYGDGVLLMYNVTGTYSISILWHREYWTIKLKAHLKPDSIKSSNTPAWPYQLLVCMSLRVYYTPRFNEVERRVYWFHLVRLSVCGQNRVCSVSSTILIGSISYLHILSSNFRRCVACNVCSNIKKMEVLANSLNL